MTRYHVLDRWVAAAKAVALVASYTFLLVVLELPSNASQSSLLTLVISIATAVLLEIVQIGGIWLHKRWGFGLSVGLYLFDVISRIVLPIYGQAIGVPIRMTALSWHDAYLLPIASYCAFRFVTYHRTEGRGRERIETP